MSRKKNNDRQTNRIKPITGQEDIILVDNKEYFKEELPLPFVFYSIDTFIAFSENPDSKKYFCTCSKLSIENFIELKTLNKTDNYESLFPYCIKEQLEINELNFAIENLNFKEKICHKCNLATPSVRSLHPMYAGKFQQYFNWYINQQYYTLGIYRNEILIDKCPDEIANIIQERLKTYEEYKEEKSKLEKLSNSIRNDISPEEITYWHNVKIEEAENYIILNKKLSQLSTKFSNFIENIVRQDFGFRKVGEGWISESILYKIIQRIFPKFEIYRHHRPIWMNGLELDIYIPKLKLAFEYQGKQHYFPIKAWGGKKALKEVQIRDKIKVAICKDEKITLIKIDYTEPLSEKYIKTIIESTVPNIG